MRSIVFRFEDYSTLALTLQDARGELALPHGQTAADGEWILAVFEVGIRRKSTASAAQVVHRAGVAFVTFESRDWERLSAFSTSRSEHFRAVQAVPSSSRASEPLPSPPQQLEELGIPSSSSGAYAALAGAVLLVDADAMSCALVKETLEHAGLDVHVAPSSDGALRALDETKVDLTVIDFDIPGLNGLDLVTRIRQSSIHAPLPILVLSAHASSRDVVAAFSAGADDFVGKPFRAPELGARIFGLLRRSRISQLPPSAVPGSRRGDG